MRLRNSSTSSSNPNRGEQIRSTLRVGLWFAGCFIALDVAINMAFPYPEIEAGSMPSQLQQYFEKKGIVPTCHR